MLPKCISRPKFIKQKLVQAESRIINIGKIDTMLITGEMKTKNGSITYLVRVCVCVCTHRRKRVRDYTHTHIYRYARTLSQHTCA